MKYLIRKLIATTVILSLLLMSTGPVMAEDGTTGSTEPAPTEEVTPPTEEVTPPTEEVTPPTEEVTPPTEEVTPPTEETTPPTEETTPPTEETGFFAFSATLASTELNIYLNNDTAGQGEDCPLTGGPYWHFVISPNNTDSYFITFHLNLGDATTYDTSIYVPNGSQLDNVFVTVPGGKTLTSLKKEGSSADISWSGDGPEPTKFQLSHVCAGSTPPVDLEVSKTAEPSYTRTFKWTIDKVSDFYEIKTSDSATFNYTIEVIKEFDYDSLWAVSGKITVYNPNNFDVSDVDVSDETPGGKCTVFGSPLYVPAQGEATAAYICTFAVQPEYDTVLINTATATWPDIGSPNTSDTIQVPYSFGDPTDLVNDEIDVTDTNGGSWHFTDSDFFEYQITYPNDPSGTCTEHENIATITQTGAFDNATVTVCKGGDPSVSKTAKPTFKRTYTWDISKAVDPTYVSQVGGTVTFNYTVNALQSGYFDSDWAVSGTITVTNVTDWEDIIVDEVLDAVPGGECNVTGGKDVTIPKSDSVDLPYSCTFAVKPDYNTDLINTATATWDKVAYFTPTGSATGTATFQFTAPTTLVDKIVTITDTFDGDTTKLGELIATDNPPFASGLYKYPHTVDVPTWNCVPYDNTAKIIGDNAAVLDQDSKTVTVCGPIRTGALTMGFWQNRNGQGIIKNGASTAGVCNSGTRLRQYAPFRDLSATATCSQVATYVFNVIKAANAGGASMNAMLKAQMLATVLDVYFIHTYGDIGGVMVDLTKIKAGGSYQDVSAAFGGATSMTISQMLAYAASQSNVGCGLWYGNVKAMQEKAKNAFDAINNQWVFAP